MRDLSLEDLREALAQGLRDLAECRTDAIFAVLLYPIIGLMAVVVGFHEALLPLLFPAAAGFALIGPAALVGVYEMTRRLERGEPVSWTDGLRVVASPAFGAILALGLMLAVLFGVWLLAAWAIYDMTLGPQPPVSALAFVDSVVSTSEGWTMAVVGCAVGFVFAALAFAVSWLAFPMLLDRNVGLPTAVLTSVRAARRNLRAAAVWGLIVTFALVVGSAPLFLGLIVVLPVLGHATWRLYRRAVDWQAPG